jgi:hypothetical protein
VRLDCGHTDVPTNGTRVLLSADAGIVAEDRILWAQFKADPDNTNDAYVGISDVSATHGFVLEASDKVGLVLDPGKYGGTIKAGVIYFDVTTNGEDITWAILFE